MNIEGVQVTAPVVHCDDRGSFTEVFRKDKLPLDVMQANCSVSKRGVIRGVHFAEIPPGQAKYITCVKGAILDVIVDIREGSPTFGEHQKVFLEDTERKAVYVPAGLGHAFQALTDDCVVSYLCSAVHSPGTEHAVNPMSLGIKWWFKDAVLSRKDTEAPSLQEAQSLGLLPSYGEWLEFHGKADARVRS